MIFVRSPLTVVAKRWRSIVVTSAETSISQIGKAVH
jgi:hypothetical protein